VPVDIIQLFSDQVYTPTRKEIRQLYHQINALIFDNKLKPFQNIKIMVKRKNWAHILCELSHKNKKSINLEISSTFPSYMIFVMTLCHEMIHGYQWFNYEKIDIGPTTLAHGKTFFELSEKFKMHHIKIQSSIGHDWIAYSKRKTKK
jgi:hypothetical protein